MNVRRGLGWRRNDPTIHRVRPPKGLRSYPTPADEVLHVSSSVNSPGEICFKYPRLSLRLSERRFLYILLGLPGFQSDLNYSEFVDPQLTFHPSKPNSVINPPVTHLSPMSTIFVTQRTLSGDFIERSGVTINNREGNYVWPDQNTTV